MKIIILNNSVKYVFLMRMNLIQELQRIGCTIYIVAPYDEYVKKIQKNGCRYVEIELEREVSLWRDLVYWGNLLRAIAIIKPDFCLSYTVKPNIFGSLACHLSDVPVINNITGLGSSFQKGKLFLFIVSCLYKMALLKSKTVFFQNPDDEKIFIDKRLVSKNQAVVLPGSGVDLRRFIPQGVNKSRKTGDFRFLFIGRIMREKGVLDLISAATIVTKWFPNAKFVLVGTTQKCKGSKALESAVLEAEKSGIVRWLGFSDDVRTLISMADCVCLPSYREGTPRVLIEAAAMGTPLIATDVPGCRQIVRDGVNGFLCRAKDPSSLANAFKKMIECTDETRRAMGEKSRWIAENEYDERLVIERYFEAMGLSAPKFIK